MSVAQSQAAVVPDENVERSQSKAKKRRPKSKKLPPYAVILHNDDVNGMDFVVGAIRKVFNYGRLQSLRLMMQAHTSGRCIVWTGNQEVAELKAEQLKACGADPLMISHGATPLGATVEPLPS